MYTVTHNVSNYVVVQAIKRIEVGEEIVIGFEMKPGELEMHLEKNRNRKNKCTDMDIS